MCIVKYAEFVFIRTRREKIKRNIDCVITFQVDATRKNWCFFFSSNDSRGHQNPVAIVLKQADVYDAIL